jgi:PAS domain S-box-containing protein
MSAQGYLAIAMHIPIFKQKTYVGSLAMLIPIDRLGELYLGTIRIRGTGKAWLLSEKGIELFCPVNDHAGKNFLDIMHHDPSAVKLLEIIRVETSGTSKIIDRDQVSNQKTRMNEKYIAFYRAPLGNTYWTILISCHEKDIYLALTNLRNRLILIFSLLLIIMSYYFYSLVKVRSVLREESKRKQAEKTLLESEEKFRKLFEDHAAIKLLIDPVSGDIIDANNSASLYYGWSREELKLMKINQINNLSPDEIRSKMEKVLNESGNQFEFKHRLKNGSLREVEVLSSKITIAGRVLLHSIIHDITERKRIKKALIVAKEQAEESDRLKTAFLQNMSHEIRTPMNAIMGFSSLLAENYNNKPKLEQYAEIIYSRCNDLLEIINGILDISKIESGQLQIHKESFDLNELFTGLTAFFREYQNRTGKQHIKFKLKADLKNQEAVIITDKVKLRQILINLIGNAFKFTENGKIEGGSKLDATGNLLFYITDTGIGIPKDKQEFIFERFAQLDHPNRTYGGTGLGLSIVKGLVSILGGKIWIESKQENLAKGTSGGTTFYFTIPSQIEA